MSDKLYAKLGRQQEEIENRAQAYSLLLNLFAGVLKGEIEPGRVMLNLTEQSWNLAEPGQSPAMPATINGLPVCVTAAQAPDPIKERMNGVPETSAKE